MRHAGSASIFCSPFLFAILALAPLAADAHGHGGGGHHGPSAGYVMVVRPPTFGGPSRPMGGFVYPRSPGFSAWPWSRGAAAAPLSDAASAEDESAREADVDERIRAAEEAPSGGGAAPSQPHTSSDGDTAGWQPL